jgi:hypothetical protein
MNRVASFQLSDLQFRALIPQAFCDGSATVGTAGRRRFGRTGLRRRFLPKAAANDKPAAEHTEYSRQLSKIASK